MHIRLRSSKRVFYEFLSKARLTIRCLCKRGRILPRHPVRHPSADISVCASSCPQVRELDAVKRNIAAAQVADALPHIQFNSVAEARCGSRR